MSNKNTIVDFRGEVPVKYTQAKTLPYPKHALVKINPDLKAVKGAPPHCYILINGYVQRCDEVEEKRRYDLVMNSAKNKKIKKDKSAFVTVQGYNRHMIKFTLDINKSFVKIINLIGFSVLINILSLVLYHNRGKVCELWQLMLRYLQSL